MRILGRVTAAFVTSLALAAASAAVAGASPTAPDPYSTRIATNTEVRTPTPIRTHTRVAISVRVTANSPTGPTGRVRLELHSAPGGGGQSVSTAAGPESWTRTIDYDGGTERVLGPQFAKPGDWVVTAVFTPADDTFRGSRDAWTFEVIDGGDDGDGDDGDDGDGGLLPDTGGPALLWLLLGVGLVGGGAGAVILARRRRPAGSAA